ncbi:MAG: hypothetical protein M1820_002376 [Bogoriella megaspora]|nr:MAG: hypothetical protein M1820_002376 [Bogoriella megaspora]
MLRRLVLGRLSTDLSKKPSVDLAHTSHKLNQLTLSINRAAAPRHFLSRSLHTSPRFWNAAAKSTSRTTRGRGRPSAKTTKTTKSTRSTKSKADPKKKAAPRKRTAKKTTKAAKKPRRRVLSEKGKARAEAKKGRDDIKQLKEIALLSTEPHGGPQGAWLVFAHENIKGRKQNAAAGQKELGERFRNLGPAEREHYNHLANENKAAFQTEYDKWVRSHSAEQIRQANAARANLRRKLTTISSNPGHKKSAKFQGRVIHNIRDDRAVKRPVNAYTQYVVERFTTGDFKGVKPTDATKLIGEEWKAMDASDKQKWLDQQEADNARYRREYEATYGHKPPTAGKTRAKATA